MGSIWGIRRIGNLSGCAGFSGHATARECRSELGGGGVRTGRLADARRTARLVRMAARVAQRPAGKVSEVFIQASELQGAYDFLEGGRVDPKILVSTLGATTMRRGAEADFLFVPVDGSSLALADDGPCKKFGNVGTVARGGRGLKVITALGVTPDGAPLGLAAQVWWARPQPQKLKRNDRHKRNRKRQARKRRLATGCKRSTKAAC